jgi:menaquinone-dependent protoporphyrinogen oxidase
MPKRILLAYESNAGSTEEVARAVADALSGDGVEVDVRRLADVDDLSGYDAAVVGAPMIVGWHRRAVKFLRRHREALRQLPVAYFMTALTLTDSDRQDLEGAEGIEIYMDPTLLKKPKDPARLSFRERHSSLASYVAPVLKNTPGLRPVGIALFAGKLDYRKLKFFQMAFVMLLFAEKPRDYRNWERIQGWAKQLGPKLLGSTLR